MPNKIERLNSVTPGVVATNSASTSPKIPYGASGGGMIFVTAVTGGANAVTWHAAPNAGDTPVPANADGSAVTTSVTANASYAIPDGLFGAPYIVAVANAGTITFTVSVKG